MIEDTIALMLALVRNSEQAITDRLLDDYLNHSKTRPPVRLQLEEGELHWHEVQKISWSSLGLTPVDFDVVKGYIFSALADSLRTLPSHEQAILLVMQLGVEASSDFASLNLVPPFKLSSWQIEQLLPKLFEQLMTRVGGFDCPDKYQASEAEELQSQVDSLEAHVGYLHRAHHQLAEAHATAVREKLVAQLRVEANSIPAFSSDYEDCHSHWDELGLMYRLGSEHLLYEVLLSTIDDSVHRSISRLPELEQYALWTQTDWGQDWLSSCEEWPRGLNTDKYGMAEAAEEIRMLLLESTLFDER